MSYRELLPKPEIQSADRRPLHGPRFTTGIRTLVFTTISCSLICVYLNEVPGRSNRSVSRAGAGPRPLHTDRPSHRSEGVISDGDPTQPGARSKSACRSADSVSRSVSAWHRNAGRTALA